VLKVCYIKIVNGWQFWRCLLSLQLKVTRSRNFNFFYLILYPNNCAKHLDFFSEFVTTSVAKRVVGLVFNNPPTFLSMLEYKIITSLCQPAARKKRLANQKQRELASYLQSVCQISDAHSSLIEVSHNNHFMAAV
jgi:hypothetical protein